MQKIARIARIILLVGVSFFSGMLITEKPVAQKSSLDEFVQPPSKVKKRRISRSSCTQNILDDLEDIAYQVLEIQERGAHINKQILCRIHGLLAQDGNDIFVSASLEQLKKTQEICAQYRVDLIQILQHLDQLLLVVRERKV